MMQASYMHQPLFYDPSFLKSCRDVLGYAVSLVDWLNSCSSTCFMLAFTKCLKSGPLLSIAFRREYAVAAVTLFD